jgi:hypothetical protein
MNRINEALKDAGDDLKALKELVTLSASIHEEDGGFSIDGNCEGDCSRDGFSHRCNCGNHRVRWAYDLGAWRPEVY